MVLFSELERGNLYSLRNRERFDWVGTTLNSFIKRDGKLVMGAGSALACKKTYDNIELIFGNGIEHLQYFGVVISEQYNVIGLQTKYAFYDPSPLGLIRRSLDEYIKIVDSNPDKRYGMPVPGVSNGGHTLSTILPLLPSRPNLTWFIYN